MRPSTQVRCKHNKAQELLFEGVRGLALLPSSRPVSEDIAPNPRAACPIMAALFYYDTFQYSTRVRAPGLDETLGALMFTVFVFFLTTNIGIPAPPIFTKIMAVDLFVRFQKCTILTSRVNRHSLKFDPTIANHSLFAVGAPISLQKQQLALHGRAKTIMFFT